MKIGDVLIAKRGRNVILGWGKVVGEYTYESERVEYRNLRKVEWYPCRTPIGLNDPITLKTLTRFTPYKTWLRDAFKRIDEEQPNGRSPNLNFGEMRIPVGSRLLSTRTGQEVIVVSQNRVTFLGENMSLSAATEKIVGYRTNPCPHWTFEGRNLRDIYEETYRTEVRHRHCPQRPVRRRDATPTHPRLNRTPQEPDPPGAAGSRQDVHRQTNRVVPDRLQGLTVYRDGAVPSVLCLRRLRAGLAADRDRRFHATQRGVLRLLQARGAAAGHALCLHHRRDQPRQSVQDLRGAAHAHRSGQTRPRTMRSR